MKLNREILEEKIWNSAELLRGLLNPDEILIIISRLLVLKRLIDEFNKKKHRFNVPIDINFLYCSIAYSFGMLGFISIIWALEKAKYEKKYFFLIGLALTIITIMGTILTFLKMAEIRETVLIIIMLGVPITGFFILVLYIQLIRLSNGIVRRKALYSLLGFIIMIAGITMDGQFFLAIEVVPLWLKMDVVPLICIGGFLIFAYAQF